MTDAHDPTFMHREIAPIIGLNCDTFQDRSGGITGVRDKYWEAIVTAGGIPLLMPHIENADWIDAVLDRVDGMLMIGGDDISPQRLGVAGHPSVVPMSPRRERSDFLLLERLLARRQPTLAICLGCQELSVLHGGTMYQDLPSEGPPGMLQHTDPDTPPYPEHPLRVAPGSLLSELWGGATEGIVNSAHHQAIREPGSGLRPIAWSPDGILEALDVPGQPFFLAVQWHPERMPDDARQRALFTALVEQARAHRGRGHQA